MSGTYVQPILSTAPFVRQGPSTSRLMLEVLAALALVVAASVYYFGPGALLVIAAATAGAMVTEWLVGHASGKPAQLRDGSALLTGVLLGLTLPPGMPLWMAALGGAVAIGLGKSIWGGLGNNVFNPALVGRAFLQAAFPQAATTWTAPGTEQWTVQASNLAWPFMHAADVVSSATPLGMAKFDGEITTLMPLLTGNTGGSLGETSALLLVVCGVWLGVRKIFDWRLPIATLLSVAVFTSLLYVISPQTTPDPLFMLCSGGLLFAAVFMVTDPVTTPITPRGAWIFGLGVGGLVVLIRLFGGLPEGVMFAILLMNAVTPLINRYTQPRRYGG